MIHYNGGRPFVVTVSGRTVNVYEDADVDGCLSSPSTCQSFVDYTDANKPVWAASANPTYQIQNVRKVLVGHDCNPSNTYIKNKGFGKGNTVMVFDGEYYHWIRGTGVERYRRSLFRGAVVAYVSPIGNNDVPYPIFFTKTNLYCDICDVCDCAEFLLPKDSASRLAIRTMCKAKSPFDVSSPDAVKTVNAFLADYQCRKNGRVIRGELLHPRTTN
jgi:hypothetical protein